MKERSLASSSSAERRLCFARRWLLEHPPRGEVLVVATSRGAADDLLHSVAVETGGLFGVERATPLRLAADLATPLMARRGLAPVSALGVEALAARTIALTIARGELEYFRPVADTPGMAKALAATLRELRLYAVERDALRASGAPGRDLVALLGVYEEVLAQWSLVDQAGLFSLADEALATGGRSPDERSFLLLDLSPISRREQDFLRALTRPCRQLLATAVSGDQEGLAALEAVLESRSEDLDPPTLAPEATRLERLRSTVFLSELPPLPSAPADDTSLLFLSAPGEGRECVEIARRIQAFSREGITFDQMAILLRHPWGYLPLVEEALRRAEIPAFFTRGTMRPHPSGRAFLALLACAAERLSATRFAEYLSLGQIPALDDGGAPAAKEVPWVEPQGDQLVFKSFVPLAEPTVPETPNVDDAEPGEPSSEAAFGGTLRTPRRWEKLLVDASVVGGRERWEKRLRGLQAELRLRLRELADEDTTHRQALERQVGELENLERFALPIIAALAALPRSDTWGAWLSALEQLAVLALRDSEKVLAVLAELRPMGLVGPVELEEVRRVLDERLRMLPSEVRERRHGKVFVGTIEEGRGRAFATVFLPGLAEGVFPRRAREDPLLLDTFRQALDAALPTQSRRVERERLLLRLAAGVARSRLVVSYPNLDILQGRSRVPSFYALDVVRAAEGRLPDQKQLEQHAAASSAALLGWPAPRIPEQAIDDSEYDLSILDQLMRRPLAEVTGMGRYLLAVSEPLGRALRLRWSRWRSGFSGADGLVHPDAATQEILAEHRLKHRSYSPTALQNYASCPYRFLLHAVHKLRPREESVPLEQLDPLTRGSLFHEVQYALFHTLEKQRLLPMRQEDLPLLRDRADAELDRVADRYREELAPAIPRVWASEIEDLRTDLQGWIRSVIGAREAWRPAYFELAFGLGSQREERDARSVAEAVEVLDGYRLRGAIDLVEADEARGVLRVTDHKTGKARKASRLVVGGGEVLQPVLYALTAERLLGRPVESGRLFYCTRRGEYHVLEVPIDDASRQKVQTVLGAIELAVEEGFLPAAPAKGACRYCDYRTVCGPLEELRLRRKKKEHLERLRQLREMP